MKKRLTSILAIAMVCVMAFAMVGCSNDNGNDANDQENTETNGDQNDGAQPDGDVDLGDAEYAVVLKVLSSQFWQTMKDGIEEEAARQGIKVDIYAANTEDDVEGQVNILENCISKGYKGIAVAPISADNLNNAIADATAKGIYVVNIDEAVNLEGLQALGGTVAGFISTDNVQVGATGAQYIVDQITDGQVAIIEGKAGAVSGEDRRDGARGVFTDADGIELVESQPADWDRTQAYDVATNYISKYPDLKAIYCCNDTMAMGALEAVKNSGKDIIVVGTDGNDDAVESVEAGELAATVAQDPATIGARGLQMLIDVVTAGAPIDVDAEPVSEGVSAILIAQ